MHLCVENIFTTEFSCPRMLNSIEPNVHTTLTLYEREKLDTMAVVARLRLLD